MRFYHIYCNESLSHIDFSLYLVLSWRLLSSLQFSTAGAMSFYLLTFSGELPLDIRDGTP